MRPWLITCFLCVLAVGPAAADTSAPADSMALQGDTEGTSFRDMTIRGEDQIRITFERPALDLTVDPLSTAGLAWDVRNSVLQRGGPEPTRAFLESRNGDQVTNLARPWLNSFAENGVATFSPQLESVDRWKLQVADSRGVTVTGFEGKGRPKPMVWDGATLQGNPALPGLTYSYSLEAFDKAGNKRTFMGKGFGLPPYVIHGETGWSMLFSGADMGRNPAVSPIIAEAADRLNRVEGPRSNGNIRIVATARSFDAAQHMADLVGNGLRSRTLGDPDRFRIETRVLPDAPESGAIEIRMDSREEMAEK